MLQELNVTLQDLNNGMAGQLVGLAFGCVVFIPFARKYGRRSTYIVSTVVVTASIWWSAFMRTSGEVVATNVLMGLAGAINETAVQMSVLAPFSCRFSSPMLENPTRESIEIPTRESN